MLPPTFLPLPLLTDGFYASFSLPSYSRLVVINAGLHFLPLFASQLEDFTSTIKELLHSSLQCSDFGDALRRLLNSTSAQHFETRIDKSAINILLRCS